MPRKILPALFFIRSRIVMPDRADSLKSIFYALGANLAIAIAKLAAAVITGSGSMLAESIHSL